MALQHFDLGQVPATPWKNGGGATRALACWPPGADMEQFDWRVSVATIAHSGPFSRFAGVDRVITLLTGDGVHLRMDCELLGGTSTDFNLMTRRGRWRGAVQVLQNPAELPARPAGLLLAVQGRWTLAPLAATSGQAMTLAPESGLWWANEDCGWSVAPEFRDEGCGLLLHVLLEPA